MFPSVQTNNSRYPQRSSRDNNPQKSGGDQKNKHWDYIGEYGPNCWSSLAPAAKGWHQSPVDIVTSETIYDSYMTETAVRTHYIPANCKTLINNGHTFQVSVAGKGSGYLYSWMEGGPFVHKYQLEQFHFHWGVQSNQGSEHSIDGEKFSAELHLVHWNTDLYSSFSEAAQSSNGLAVLTVLYKVGREHRFLKKLTDLLSSVPYSGDSIALLRGFDPGTLLPHDRSSYYTYSGSLTTPPCTESARFLIFKTTLELSEQQLREFRRLNSFKKVDIESRDEFGGKILCNCRPIQPLNDRRIVRSSADSINRSSANNMVACDTII